jgi:hypothetical protein
MQEVYRSTNACAGWAGHITLEEPGGLKPENCGGDQSVSKNQEAGGARQRNASMQVFITKL